MPGGEELAFDPVTVTASIPDIATEGGGGGGGGDGMSVPPPGASETDGVSQAVRPSAVVIIKAVKSPDFMVHPLVATIGAGKLRQQQGSFGTPSG